MSFGVGERCYQWEREGKDVGKGCRRVNMVQILCAHVYKWKDETYFDYSRNGGERDKEEWWRS
jgi:hypothetical protein